MHTAGIYKSGDDHKYGYCICHAMQAMYSLVRNRLNDPNTPSSTKTIWILAGHFRFYTVWQH